MKPRVLAVAIALGVLIADRATKLWIQANFTLYDTRVVIPGLLDIVHSENPGMAFGLLAGHDSPWRGFVLIGVSLAILVVLARLLWHSAGRRQQAALALVMGGATGNLYDRVVRGAVTDFIDVHVGVYHWPTFNVADSAITAGALLLAADLWLHRKPRQRGAEA